MSRNVTRIEEYLDELEVETIYGIRRRTLQTWRYLGKHLPFHRVGRCVRYRKADVEAFISKNQVLVSA